MARLLPDRERRHLLQFYCCKSLGYGARLAIAISLICAALALQLFTVQTSIFAVLFVTLPVLLLGNLFLLVRGYSLEPASLTGGDWEKTTRDRFHEVVKLEDDVKSWDETFVDITCTTGCLSLVGVLGAVAVAVVVLASQFTTEGWSIIFAADAAVLILPHWVTGTRRGWKPVALHEQLVALETSLKLLDTYNVPPCQVQPMFEMVGTGDKRTPSAARVFVRFPDGPEAFLGLQIQVSINNVQGTKYAYLYAVLIAKTELQMVRRHFGAILASAPSSVTVESSTEEGVDVIVIRQYTTKTSGYHTDKNAIRRVTDLAWSAAAAVLYDTGQPVAAAGYGP